MKVFGKILASLYSIFFTLVLFGFIIIFILTSYLKPNFVENVFTNKQFMETKLSDIGMDFDGKEEIEKLCGKDCTIKDAIVSAASDGFGIRKELVNEALNDEDFLEAGSILVNHFIGLSLGTAKEIDYDDYDDILDKRYMKEILNDLNLSKKDIKNAIDDYNKELDKFNNSQFGGMMNEQSVVSR